MLLGVDVGGTFTDAVLVDDGTAIHTAKVATTPADESLGVIEAVRLVLERAGATAERVERFAHGMTVATNALLEGRAARTALIATAGFTDVIELGRQRRAHLYRLSAAAPAPLVEAGLRFGAPERMGPDGPLRALSPEDARVVVEELALTAPEAVAVSLLHSYADPAHERLLGELLAELMPDAHVSLSSDVVGTFREFERTATTVLDAALSPLLADYLGRLDGQARALGLRAPEIMQSSGGLTDIERAGAHAALTVLSGPAGGVGAAQLLAEAAAEPKVLCFDMGGTSCDVCVIDEAQVPETAERTIAGRPFALPALDIHTVGAGGGSIAWRDPGGALRVGPASAGARPGPACYGRGGERATVTDANLLLGRIPEDIPLAGGLALDATAAQHAISALANELGLTAVACAEGIVRVAEAEMLGALRLMTVERGIDPRDFALMPFGGAGALHACALARELGIERVLCPRAAGVLSALGLAAASPRRDVARTVSLRGDSLTRVRLDHERRRLLAEVTAALGEAALRARVSHELRYRGQAFELRVEEELYGEQEAMGPEELRAEFAEAHERRYGYRDDAGDVELVTMRASVWGASPALRPTAALDGVATREDRAMIWEGRRVESLTLRGEPAPGTALDGPALLALPDATVLVAPGWSAEVDDAGTIHLRHGPAG